MVKDLRALKMMLLACLLKAKAGKIISKEPLNELHIVLLFLKDNENKSSICKKASSRML